MQMLKIFKYSCTEFIIVHIKIPLQDPSFPLYPHLPFSLSLALSHQNSSFNLNAQFNTEKMKIYDISSAQNRKYSTNTAQHVCNCKVTQAHCPMS